MMRSDLFRSFGGFDEHMTAAEDYDLWLRILIDHEAGLLDEPLVTRRGGHPDQLSATTPALDRFRILALAKLLARRLAFPGAANLGRRGARRKMPHLRAAAFGGEAESTGATCTNGSLTRREAGIRARLLKSDARDRCDRCWGCPWLREIRT